MIEQCRIRRSGPPRCALRWVYLTLLASAACGPALGEDATATSSTRPVLKPNLALIIIDTLRADALGAYGNPLDPTPELDRIADGGTVFEHALAPCSWTRPSIGSMLTSLYPRTLGLYVEQNERLPGDATTLAEILKANGYATFGATANPSINSVYGFGQGFDEYVDSTVLFPWMPSGGGPPVPRVHPLSSAENVFAKALKFAEAHPEGPAYLQTNVMEMHEVGKKKTLTRPEFATMYPDTPNGPYFGTATQVSKAVGEFLGALTGLAGWKHTLVVITSDHGEGLDSHPHVANSWAHGFLLYQSTVRVPWIIGGPGYRGGIQRVNEQVGLIDMAPTILAMMGIKPHPNFMGTDVLAPQARGKARNYFVETRFRDREKYALYTPQWKFFDNNDGLDGLPSVELQPRFSFEDGARTSRATSIPETANTLARELRSWKQAFPANDPTPVGGAIDPETLEQLRGIGYR